MRSSQWSIFGVGLWIISFILMYMSSQAQLFCLESGYLAGDVSCMRWSAFSPFVYTLFLLGVICFINGWIESHSKKKEEKVDTAKSLQRLLDLSDEKFVRQMIRKYNLKEGIKDIEELEEISKKDRKNEKKIKDEIEKYFKNTEEMREGFLNNLKKGS